MHKIINLQANMVPETESEDWFYPDYMFSTNDYMCSLSESKWT